MTDTAPGLPTEHAADYEEIHPVAGGTAVATPEFDRREVANFSSDDGHAVSVIGKMLVGFFFYSLLIMLLVTLWTMTWGAKPLSETAAHGQANEAEHGDE
jgi:hypothetical protein